MGFPPCTAVAYATGITMPRPLISPLSATGTHENRIGVSGKLVEGPRAPRTGVVMRGGMVGISPAEL